jgi:cytochrome c-type biogenesis protein CcmE
MKKIHIILLVLIVAAIAVLISLMPSSGGLTTYESIANAKNMQGKTVHIVAKLDKSKPVEYDQVKNPNYLSFTAVDSLGGTVKVIYNSAKPDNLEHSDRLVMKGKMVGDQFECNNIMMKCPSKYSDDPNRIQESMNKNSK